MGDRELVRRLRWAQADGDLVRVRRRGHLVTHEGYVLAVGERWLLLANLDPAIVLDGFVRSALTLRGQWPPAPPPTPVALDDTRALLGSVDGRWPLVTIHPELDDPEVCFIGEVQRVGRKTVSLREITPDATWREPREAYRLGRITRVDVGGSHERALIEVATSSDDPSRQPQRPAEARSAHRGG